MEKGVTQSLLGCGYRGGSMNAYLANTLICGEEVSSHVRLSLNFNMVVSFYRVDKIATRLLNFFIGLRFGWISFFRAWAVPINYGLPHQISPESYKIQRQIFQSLADRENPFTVHHHSPLKDQRRPHRVDQGYATAPKPGLKLTR